VIRVGYLVGNPSIVSGEERGAWKFLQEQKDVKAKRLTFESIKEIPASLRSFDLLWWHFDSSVDLPFDSLDPQVLTSIASYLRRGGRLLLSLLASQYTVPLQIETAVPNVRMKGPWTEESWAQDYPDIRGFGSRGSHPIFDGFLGGLYTWSPKVGARHSVCYYENNLPASGRVVAVEKLYIKLNEQRRNVVEYSVGKGRVLAIGCHLYFEEAEHRFRLHLERFARNCLLYLARMKRGRRHSGSRTRGALTKTYWSFEERTVEASKHHSKPIGSISSSLLPTPDRLTIRRDLEAADDAEEQFFDLGGKRILLMGKERSGLLEAWCHPVRILKDLRVGIKTDGRDLIWTDYLNPRVTVKPDSFTREYQLEDAAIEEITFADRSRPCGAVHYRIKGLRAVELVLVATIDLRVMWPLSEDVTGSLRFAWDDRLQGAFVSADGGSLVSLLGCSVKPNAHLVGRFQMISVHKGELVGTPTDEVQVAVAFRFTLATTQPECTVAFAGSSQGEPEAVSAYRSIIKNPQRRINEQARHFKELDRHYVQVNTPDQEFNESYRWALAATDRFFVGIPGLGSSFMAGYGLSDSGWNGGHKTSGRPGYAWYFGRDSVWTSLGVLAYGNLEQVRSVLEFLGRTQDVDGKILHELTASGHAHYDAADSTPLYLILMGRYLRASGDLPFVRKEFPRICRSVDFCFQTDTDGDHLIENTNVGHGWVEGGKLFPVHTEHYLAACWGQALEESGFVARSIGRDSLGREWRRESVAVRKIICTDFWNPKTGCFNFGKLWNGSYRKDKTSLTAPGIYFGCGSQEQASQCLSLCNSMDFSADWGVRIVGRNDPLYNPTGYHYGSVWPLFTGWAALAEFVGARPVQAFQHICSSLGLFRAFSAGYTVEVLHGERFQPAGVCPHQAWSETMVLQPLLEGMFGLKVDSLGRTLSFRPYFPPEWPTAEIKNIRVGNQAIELRMNREKGQTVFRFRSSTPRPINVQLQPYFPLGTRIDEILEGSKRSDKRTLIREYCDVPVVKFKLVNSAEVAFRHSGGVAVLPPIPILKKAQESSGLRTLEEKWTEREYILEVEGKAACRYSLLVFDYDQSIRSAQGAEMGRRSGEKLELLLTIDEDKGSGSYGRKKVELILSRKRR
jgi:glycogen debranching enzyme